MAAFTAMADGFTPQLFMAEIVDAVNERRACAIASGATGLPAAIAHVAASVKAFQGDATNKPVHLLIQEMLEALAPWYVDHGATVPVDTPYTVSTWRSRATISSGFRRATTWADPTADPSFSYGLIQTGDIAGYWIWADIVLGLKALQKTAIGTYNLAYYSATTASGATEAAAKADADAVWDSTKPAWSLLGNFNHRTSAIVGPHPAGFYCEIIAVTVRLNVDFSTNAPLSADVAFYAYCEKPAGYGAFFDCEGWVENQWNQLDGTNIIAGASTAQTPFDSINLNMPGFAVRSGATTGNSFGSEFTDGKALITWNFSRV